MRSNNGDADFGLVAAFFITVVFLAMCHGWYKASVQAAVYQREGIQMSTWEVFLGAKPAERTINLKQ